MKKVIITGGSRGIGKEIINNLLKDKYFVFNISRQEKFFQKKKNLQNFKGDVANFREIKIIFEKIFKDNDIYALINNAGINPSRKSITNTSLKDFASTLSTNLVGPFNCSKLFLQKLLKKKRPGVIINISSIMGIVSAENRCSYSISKFGLVGLTKSLTADYSSKKIRNFCICPGYIETSLTKPFIKSLSKPDKIKLINQHKLKKLGKPIDVYNLINFLLDEKKSSWMTGNIIPVDGAYIG